MKRMCHKLISGILIIYFFGAFIFFSFYSWQYVINHGFTKWIFEGESVVTWKAVTWPYFVFIESDDTSSHFSKAINYKNKATEIINKSAAYKKLSQTDMDKIIGHYKKALTEAKKADTESMNKYYPEFGDHFRSEFMKGLELFIQSYDTVDMKASIESQILLDQWGNWYQANFDGLRGR